jgi:NAD(P)-dependent dehydrogenase (short-subunit alcohol dehydrogenase family)
MPLRGGRSGAADPLLCEQGRADRLWRGGLLIHTTSRHQSGVGRHWLAERDPSRKAPAVVSRRSLGRPDDIADVVAALSSPDCAWITGQVINAEGGFRR